MKPWEGWLYIAIGAFGMVRGCMYAWDEERPQIIKGIAWVSSGWAIAILGKVIITNPP